MSGVCNCRHATAVAIGALVMASVMLTGCPRSSTPDDADRSADTPGTTRLAGLLGADDSDFERVYAAREFEFPRDHGPHPDYRNEWWYVTGNLWSPQGARFGYELTLFRFSLTPGSLHGESAWRSNQLYVGHFAVSDAGERNMHIAERYARGALGLAGAGTEPVRIWLEDWEIRGSDNGSAHAMPWRLTAADGDVAIDVELVAMKPPVLNGRDGLSQKSSEPGNASYYYSMTRLQTRGSLRVGDRSIAVEGTSWLDREWSSSALAADQQGWDWFALQFDDHTELMFYQIRRSDGSRDPMSAGTWIEADGVSRYLQAGDVELTVLDHWDSPSGGRYPAAWRLVIPRYAVDVRVVPVFEDQELDTAVRYWEGAVDVDGRSGEQAVGGHGYVELTGYADPSRRRSGAE